MDTYNIHYAKTHLSRLIEEAMKGKSFVIAKGGRPMVKVTPFRSAEAVAEQRIGFMNGEIRVPDDFDEMGKAEIEALFGTRE